MVSIHEILENDHEVLFREIGRREYDSHWLGTRALFIGGKWKMAGYYPAVAEETEDFLRTATRSNPNGASAWQFNFSGSQHLSVLYALASEAMAEEIRMAHVKAVLIVLAETAGCLQGIENQSGFMGVLLKAREDFGHPPCQPVDLPPKVFLVSTAVMAHDGSPNLHTTAILGNTVASPNGPLRSLATPQDIERIRIPLSITYAAALDHFTEQAIGPFHRVPDIGELRIEGIPQEVVRRFCLESPPPFERGNLPNRPLPHKAAISANWRAQGEMYGWGPKEAAAFLRGLRRERFWNEVKAKCTYVAQNPSKALLEVTAPLRRVLAAQKEQTQAEQQKDKDKTKSNTHTHSH
jgi:hypothetical protein